MPFDHAYMGVVIMIVKRFINDQKGFSISGLFPKSNFVLNIAVLRKFVHSPSTKACKYQMAWFTFCKSEPDFLDHTLYKIPDEFDLLSRHFFEMQDIFSGKHFSETLQSRDKTVFALVKIKKGLDKHLTLFKPSSE